MHCTAFTSLHLSSFRLLDTEATNPSFLAPYIQTLRHLPFASMYDSQI
jgi:hypothetical protein